MLISNFAGSSRQMTRTIKLPLYLVIRPCPPIKNANHKITIESNKASANLNNIFPGKFIFNVSFH